jgi:SAM-dependent methyltransferase
MNAELKKSMLDYYEARAAEYDEIYILGTAPGSTSDPNVFKQEVQVLAGLVTEHVRGRVLDAACGAGFWIKYYVANATAITLADHSENMLNQSRRKVDALGATRLTTFIRGDLVDGPLPSGPFDAALIAFFLSHLTDSQMDDYFAKLRTVLAPGANLLMLDSVYSVRRRHSDKAGRKMRTLRDGRQFEIYKRYFEPDDFPALNRRWGTDFRVVHVGEVYMAAAGGVRS